VDPFNHFSFLSFDFFGRVFFFCVCNRVKRDNFASMKGVNRACARGTSEETNNLKRRDAACWTQFLRAQMLFRPRRERMMLVQLLSRKPQWRKVRPSSSNAARHLAIRGIS
jgi:hypothetical protein